MAIRTNDITFPYLLSQALQRYKIPIHQIGDVTQFALILVVIKIHYIRWIALTAISTWLIFQLSHQCASGKSVLYSPPIRQSPLSLFVVLVIEPSTLFITFLAVGIILPSSYTLSSLIKFRVRFIYATLAANYHK